MTKLQSTLQQAVGLLTLALMVSPSYASDATRSDHEWQEKINLCTSCHTVDGNSATPDYPKLSGLHTDYIVKQLTDFKAGKRTSLFMGPIITQIEEKEFKALAEYFSAKKRVPEVAVASELAAQGKKIFESGFVGRVDACSKCHGNEGEGTKTYPRLNGQHSKYIVSQLQNLKSGARSNDNNEEMRKVAKQLSEPEMKAVAEYIASLKEEEPQE
ncbi:MAG: cytochrome c4 [Methylotenera sp.]|nr:cytochrome c4 [Methylotenera sp.]